MKLLAGVVKPRSWCRMKLTTKPNDGLGSRSAADGTIHVGSCPSTFGASWQPFTSSFSAKSVTVERCHGSGSSTWIGWVGAIAIGGGAWGRSKHKVEMKGRVELWNRSKEQG
jgi:hypothetical protein